MSRLRNLGIAAGALALIGASLLAPSIAFSSEYAPTYVDRTTCRTDYYGTCSVEHGLGLTPGHVSVTVSSPTTVSVAVSRYYEDSFKIHVTKADGKPYRGGNVVFSYAVFKPEPVK